MLPRLIDSSTGSRKMEKMLIKTSRTTKKDVICNKNLSKLTLQGAMVKCIERSALETEFMGSNPSNGKVVFLMFFPSLSFSSPSLYSVSGMSRVVPL